MSSSDRGFTLGGLDQAFPRPTQGPSVVTAAPFAIAPEPSAPASAFQPMVFQPFDGRGKIVSVHDDEPEPPVAQEEIVAEIEVVEPEELPAPPPPDFEALKADAWREGFQLGYDEGLRLAAEEQHDTGTRLSAL